MTALTAFTDDQLIAELESRGRVNSEHYAELRIGDFSMKHTMRCHPNLFACDIHKKLEEAYLGNVGLAPLPVGLYKVRWNAEGKLDFEYVKPLPEQA